MSDIVKEAIEFAKHNHSEQKRKYNGLPYFVHLEEVANLYGSTCGGDSTGLAVCYLHDVVEDTGVTIYDLYPHFGSEITESVRALTDIPDPSKNRATRKAETCKRISEAAPYVQNIKLCDMLSNAFDICRYDPKFAKTFLKEFWEMSVALTQCNPELHDLVGAFIGCAEERLS